MCHISHGSVWRIAKERVASSKKSRERAKTASSPKLSARQGRLLLRKIVHVREEKETLLVGGSWREPEYHKERESKNTIPISKFGGGLKVWQSVA